MSDRPRSFMATLLAMASVAGDSPLHGMRRPVPTADDMEVLEHAHEVYLKTAPADVAEFVRALRLSAKEAHARRDTMDAVKIDAARRAASLPTEILQHILKSHA